MSEYCEIFNFINRYRPILYQQVFQILSCIASIFLIFLGRLIQKPAYFHPNVKILLKLFQFSMIFYSFAIASSQLYHLLASLLFSNCEFLISSRLCFPFRFIATTTVSAFVFLTLSIPVERAIATKNLGKGYENRKSEIGAGMGYVALTVSITISLILHIPQLYTEIECDNCIYSTPTTVLPISKFTIIATWLLSAGALLLILVLLWYNRAQLARKTYSLSIEFQINQNLRILHLILPITILTFLTFLAIGAAELSPIFSRDFEEGDDDGEVIRRRSWRMMQNLFPIYTLLCSTIWLIQMLIKRKSQKRASQRLVASLAKKVDEKNVYFQTLQNQWGGAYPSTASSTTFSSKKTSTVLPARGGSTILVRSSVHER
ncbi:unnamed protein product [Caenorhabditis angaria]|uniref:Uncharacterized protein n=1 Tax=Caenorhabditis angaria TaxID=860376 RepID=A0A9P1N3W3_9PELO|nr:unnamed protein product [Caenorhabditis angaria]